MAKFLNNKFAIAGLVVLAGTLLYFRVVLPFIDFFFPEQFEDDLSLLETDYDSENLYQNENVLGNIGPNNLDGQSQLKIAEIDFSNLRWNSEPARDPFNKEKTDTGINLEKVFIVSRQFAADISSNGGPPRVSAIVLMPNLKFAVIEGEVLKEGDSYGNFVLHSIEEDAVFLTQQTNRSIHRVAVKQ